MTLSQRPRISPWVAAGLEDIHIWVPRPQVDIVITPKESKKEEAKEAAAAKTPKLRDVICDAFSIPREVLFTKVRKREIITARHFYIYLVCEVIASGNPAKKTGPSQTARHLGWKKDQKGSGWDHATVIHACGSVRNLRDTDKWYHRVTNDIIRRLFSGEILLPDVNKVIEELRPNE